MNKMGKNIRIAFEWYPMFGVALHHQTRQAQCVSSGEQPYRKAEVFRFLRCQAPQHYLLKQVFSSESNLPSHPGHAASIK